jgi:hypothetical protein
MGPKAVFEKNFQEKLDPATELLVISSKKIL